MRRFHLAVVLLLSCALLLCFTGCSGDSPSVNIASKVTVTPSTISINRGEVYQLTPSITDKNGGTVTADLNYASNNTNLLTINASGQLCGGTWDSNGVVCTTTPCSGTGACTGKATVTVTVAKTSVSTTADVFVHERVDRVLLDNPGSACLSTGGTKTLTASAFSTDPAVCTRLGGSVPCPIPSDSVGQFTFFTADPEVVTLNNTDKPGLLTATSPGKASLTASLSNVNSPAQPFVVCPVVSLTLTRKDTTDTTPFTLDNAKTITVSAVAVDSTGVTLTGPALTYLTGSHYGMTAAADNPTVTGTVTANAPGISSVVSVECAPPTCNKNLNAVYSNGIFGAVNGTMNAPVVYVASTKSLSLFPVDTSTNTVGTEIKLPFLPNSFQMNHLGTKALLGSDNNPLMLLDVTAGTTQVFKQVTSAKVLAMSPDGAFGLVTNASGTYIINLGTANSTIGAIYGNALRGGFTPDSRLAFYTTGTGTLYVLDMTASKILQFPQGANINDISVMPTAQLTYLAQPSAIAAMATCNYSTVDTQTAAAPSRIAALPDGTGAIALAGSNAILVAASQVSNTCPPTATETTSTVPLNIGATPDTLQVGSDAKNAVAYATGSSVGIVRISTGTAVAVPLTGGTVQGTGALTANGASLYVGGSDNKVHKVDVTAGTDASQIAVTLKDAAGAQVAPDLIVIRNK